jgi:outer membrane protein assembly factor BamB
MFEIAVWRAMGGRNLMTQLVAWTVVCVLCQPDFVAGQDARKNKADVVRDAEGEAGESNLFMPAPRNLRQQLSRAAKALEEGRHSEAVDLLGQVLASPGAGGTTTEGIGDQDYFLTETDANGSRTSLKTRAQQMLGQMPEQGRELYELRFGADARQMLEQALTSRDMALLGEVTRRYFHTRAGNEASLLTGRFYLDQGKPLAAALQFERLASSDVARQQYDPELSVLLATSWFLADMPARATETLVELQARAPQSQLRIGDKDVSLFQGGADPLNWLRQLVGPVTLASSRRASDWVVFRGDPARNAESAGDLPLLTPRWKVRAANHPSDEEVIAQQREAYENQGVAALPSLQPLAVGNTVLMREPRWLMAIDLATGKRIWNFPWFDTADEPELKPTERFRPDVHMPNSFALELHARVWDDAPYGQMSSDGKQVFLLWKLPSAFEMLPARVLQFGQQMPGLSAGTNRLVALDLQAEGKMRWIVGDEDGTDEPALAGAFFLGPPLPLQGQLYALAEMAGELKLVVLNGDTGRLEWSQQLAQVDQTAIGLNPTRRAAGASPSFSDGILVCPTSAGAVVAVDVATRALLWGYQYGPETLNRRVGMGVYPMMLRRVGDRWTDATVTISDGRVLLTPVESDQLHCLDLLTGKRLWEPKDRLDLLYVACASQGRAVLVGREQVQAISLEDGSVQWTKNIPHGIPSGRGMFSQGAYLLPTTAKHLLKFDVKTGEIVADIETDQILGNLIACNDQIISQNVDWVSAYYQSEPLRAVVENRLRESPDDVWGLTRRAELLMYDGQHTAAVDALRRAYQLAPQDDSIRASLVTALMAALRSDFASNTALAGELESLLDQPGQRAEFYRLMASGLRQANDVNGAVDYFLKLAVATAASSSEEADEDRVDMVRIDSDLRVRRDRWIGVNLTELIAQADLSARARIDNAILERFDAITAGESLRELRRFVNCFGRHPLGAEAELHLARVLLARDATLEAELHLVNLQSNPEPQIAATATELLAKLLLDAGRLPEAAACFEQLAQRFGDVTLRGTETGRTIASAALADKSLEQVAGQVPKWPYGKVVITHQPRGTFPTYQSLFPIDFLEISGPFPADSSLVYHRQQNTLVMRDGAGSTQMQVTIRDGDRVAMSTLNAPAGSAVAKGHVLIVNVGTDVLAIDALQATTGSEEAILWRGELSNSLAGAGTTQTASTPIIRPWGPTRHVLAENQMPVGSIGPITTVGFVFQRMQELSCVDPLSGDSIWIRGGQRPGSDLFGDDEYLFVAVADRDDATVLRTADGAVLGTRFVGSRRDRWFTAGRRVLCCTISDKKLVLRWFDAWSEQEIWRREFPADAQCWSPSREEITVMERSGKFTALNVQDGQTRFETQLAEQPELARLYVLKERERYLVMSSNKITEEDEAMVRYRPWTPIGSDQCPQIDGRIIALDSQTGQPLWPAAAEVRQLCCPLDQPKNSAGLVLLQNIQPPGTATAPRPQIKGIVVCLDKRDGRQILLDEDQSLIRTYAMAVDTSANILTISTNSKQVALQFTDEPVEKQPPLRYEPAPPPPGAMEQAGKIAKGLLQIIAKPKADAKKENPQEEPKEVPKDDAQGVPPKADAPQAAPDTPPTAPNNSPQNVPPTAPPDQQDQTNQKDKKE